MKISAIALLLTVIAGTAAAQEVAPLNLRPVSGTPEEALALAYCARPEARPRKDGSATTLYAYCAALETAQEMLRSPVAGRMEPRHYAAGVNLILTEGRALGLGQ